MGWTSLVSSRIILLQVDLFQVKLKKYQFEVQVNVFKISSSENNEKVFLIKEFLQNYYPFTNQQKIKVKEHFIQSIKLFQ